MRVNETDLQMAERHVLAGEQQILRQRELIVWLRERGHSTQEAERLLANLDDAHKMHRDHVARLKTG